MMRMKDSDDYITARAANPRTGLISPSLGTRSPCTPASPGEALKLYSSLHTTSPTKRPTRKANEGKKLSGGGREDDWYLNKERRSTSTKNDEEDDGGSSLLDRNSSMAPEDQFVVHMPSAREPQPFAYPGYTPEQIEALEHYRDKTRRVSSEGYDRRLLQARSVSGPRSEVRFCCEDNDDNDDEMFSPVTVHGHRFTPYQARSSTRVPAWEKYKEPAGIHLPKRGCTAKDSEHHRVRTSQRRTTSDGIDIQNNHHHQHHPRNHVNYNQEAQTSTAPTSRTFPSTAQVSAPRRKPVPGDDQHFSEDNRFQHNHRHHQEQQRWKENNSASCHCHHCHTNLASLSPRSPVRLVGRRRSSATSKCSSRQWSLECVRGFDGEDSFVVQPRATSSTSTSCDNQRRQRTGSVVIRRKPVVLYDTSPLQASHPPSRPIPDSSLLTLLLSLFLHLHSLIRSIPTISFPPPISLALATLRSSESSVREKVEALKALLSFTAHLLAAGVVVVVGWKVVEVVRGGFFGVVVAAGMLATAAAVGWATGLGFGLGNGGSGIDGVQMVRGDALSKKGLAK